MAPYKFAFSNLLSQINLLNLLFCSLLEKFQQKFRQKLNQKLSCSLVSAFGLIFDSTY